MMLPHSMEFSEPDHIASMRFQVAFGDCVTSLRHLPDPGPSQVVVLVLSEPLLRTDRWEEFLTPFELSRARLLARESEQLRFMRGRHLLRKILGHYLSLQPSTVSIAETQNGKPVVLGKEGIHFNLSHSDRWLCMAFSRSSPVGIDVERLRPLGEAERAAMRMDGYDPPSNAEGENLDTQYFNRWVTHEALIKAAGSSLAKNPPVFGQLRDSRFASATFSGDATWCATRIDLGAEAVASLAFRTDQISSIEVRSLGEPLS
jgi:4'-phosphopantetheinyl transferase